MFGQSKRMSRMSRLFRGRPLGALRGLAAAGYPNFAIAPLGLIIYGSGFRRFAKTLTSGYAPPAPSGAELEPKGSD